MKFKKGQSGNPAGRPRGSKDKKTEHWEQLGEYLINQGAERFMRLLEESDDKEFKKDFALILQYFKPKQIRSDNTHTWNGELPKIIIQSADGNEDNED